MTILRLTHDEGVQRISALLLEENLIPVIGSGFTKGCASQNGMVPDGSLATELMKKIISEFKPINLASADFNKTSERFFSIVPKERQWEFFRQYFTKVHLDSYMHDFLALPWPYIYTLNIDDGIENTGLYTAVLPYHDANLPATSMKLLYKLHGDAKYEVLYKVQLDLAEYGINSVIIVRDYELFYREVVNNVNQLVAEETVAGYQFTNPGHKYLEPNNQEENLAYFSGRNIFQESENVFYKSQFQIVRTCVQEIETQLENNSSVIIRGRRFSGKTFVLSTLAERFKKYTVFYFPSETTIDEDVLVDLLKNKSESIFLFDSNSLTDYSYHQVANSEKLLRDNHNKLVITVNSNDLYLSDALNAEIILVPAVFNQTELNLLQPISDSFGLIRRKERETNVDYLKALSDEQKIPLSLFDKVPKTFTKEESIILILLSIKDKLYFSDISALGLHYRTVDRLIDRMQGIIERVPVAKGEKYRHSSEKLVHNSKYYMLYIMKSLSSAEIIEAILHIVSHLVKDPVRKRLYVEAVLFDTLNQLFGYSKGAGKLIFDIYDALSPYLSQDMDYWLQRAKSIYRLRPNNYGDLLNAYQYAKKALGDGNPHLRAKASLTTSLICCLLAKLCTDPLNIDNYEREAIVCADSAISSTYFSINKSNLKGELRNGYRQPYSKLIRVVCDKHLTDSESVQIMWKAAHVKKLLDELET